MHLRKQVLNSCVVIVLICSSGCATFDRLQSSGALHSVEGQPQINLLAARQAGSVDCGVACLSGVLKYWGSSVSQDAIKTYLGKPPKGGYTLAQLKEYAEHAHFSGFILEGSYELLQKQCQLGRPCIIVIKKSRKANHSLIVFDIKSREKGFNLSIMDPASGKMKNMSSLDIDSRWAATGRPVLLVGLKEKEQQL